MPVCCSEIAHVPRPTTALISSMSTSIQAGKLGCWGSVRSRHIQPCARISYGETFFLFTFSWLLVFFIRNADNIKPISKFFTPWENEIYVRLAEFVSMQFFLYRFQIELVPNSGITIIDDMYILSISRLEAN